MDKNTEKRTQKNLEQSVCRKRINDHFLQAVSFVETVRMSALSQ